MHPHPEHKLRDTQTGFTLVELVIVIAVLGIMSVYVMMKGVSPAEMSLPSQAQKLASDIGHAQTLAFTSGKRMRFTIVTAGANGTYGVTCVTAPTPCNTDFSVTLQKDVVLAGSTLYFNSLGQPSDSLGQPVASAASYTLTSGASAKTISVAAQSGIVAVSP